MPAMPTDGKGVAEMQTVVIAIYRAAGTGAGTDVAEMADAETDVAVMAGAETDADPVDVIVTVSTAETVIVVDATAETWTVVDVTVTVPFCNMCGCPKAFLILSHIL